MSDSCRGASRRLESQLERVCDIAGYCLRLPRSATLGFHLIYMDAIVRSHAMTLTSAARPSRWGMPDAQ